MLTTAEAAASLGASPSYLTRLLRSGKLPYLADANRYLVAAAGVHAFQGRADRKLRELAAVAPGAAGL